MLQNSAGLLKAVGYGLVKKRGCVDSAVGNMIQLDLNPVEFACRS